MRNSAIASVAALVLLAGCSSAEEDPEAGSATAESSEALGSGQGASSTGAPGVEPDASSAVVGDDLSDHVTIDGEPLTAPEFVWVSDEAPEGLIVDVLVEGDGAVVAQGGYVKAHYEGRVWGSEEPFDSSYAGETGVAFPLDGVVAGWRDGIPGSKVGSRLLISIPSELGYANGNPNAGIEVGDTIVFVVDVIDTDAVPAADAVAENAGVMLEEDAPIAFTSQDGAPAEFTLKADAEAFTETKITTIGEGTGDPIEMGDWVAIAYSARNVATDEYFSTWVIADAQTSGKPEVAILGQGTIIDLAVGQTIGSRVMIEVSEGPDGPVVFVVDLLSALLTE